MTLSDFSSSFYTLFSYIKIGGFLSVYYHQPLCRKKCCSVRKSLMINPQIQIANPQTIDVQGSFFNYCYLLLVTPAFNCLVYKFFISRFAG